MPGGAITGTIMTDCRERPHRRSSGLPVGVGGSRPRRAANDWDGYGTSSCGDGTCSPEPQTVVGSAMSTAPVIAGAGCS